VRSVTPLRVSVAASVRLRPKGMVRPTFPVAAAVAVIVSRLFALMPGISTRLLRLSEKYPKHT
jgi:hypothetical protein